MYTHVGSMIAAAVMKLNPIHRNLTEMEITNVRDFFNSDFISPERRRQIGRMGAFFMTYFNAIKRISMLSKQARQDYYALQRQGCFAAEELTASTDKTPDCERPTILIVPGLNTPSVFFREMHSYFTN